MEFIKPFLTFDEQANLPIRRGMVADRDDLIGHLRDVGNDEIPTILDAVTQAIV